MERIQVAEQIIGLGDNEILTTMLNIDGLAKRYAQLVSEVYSDETLSQERQMLHEGTQRTQQSLPSQAIEIANNLLGSIKAESDESVVFEKLNIALSKIQEIVRAELGERRTAILEALPTKLRAILKVRIALQRALSSIPTPIYHRENEDKYDALRRLVIEMQDGDLAYSTYYWIGTHGAEPVVLETMRYSDFLNDLRFSPEFQMDIATGGDRFKIANLAGNKYLTEEAQVAIFNTGKDGSRSSVAINRHANSDALYQRILELEGEEGEYTRMIFGFSDRDFDEATLARFQDYPKLALILRAKVDSSAELEMIDQAIADDDERWLRAIARKSKLFSEEAVRKLNELAQQNKIKIYQLQRNKNLTNHPVLIEELGIESL
jgi:hypothetical protein